MTLDELEALIDSSRSPKELFGPDPDDRAKKLLKVCHPDRNPGDKRAESLFKKLSDLRDELNAPRVKVKSPKREYELVRLLATGDAADIWLAESGGKDYVFKASRFKGADALMEAERQAISVILKQAGSTSYARYFPTLAESFPIRDKFPKRVNVFVKEEGWLTLEQVHTKKPVLDGRHLAWMFKRILVALGFAHKAGVFHGAVLLSHVMIHPAGHGAQLIGWGQSPGDRIVKAVSTKWKDFYAPEILAKKPVSEETDIYMAAKCMLRLSMGTEPALMRSFFAHCLLEGQRMRPGDAWKLHDEFDELLKQIYGKPKFIPLTL